ncbi:MAG: trypsin-like peptidase domain-containing protein [Prevotella sp.]|nr:trypsin-like peptidase domain-containing protein [Prevotella sp.]
MKTKFYSLALAILALPLLYGCPNPNPKTKLDGMQSKVIKVKDGNHIELRNGLTVEILGIKPSEHTKDYLEKHVKGEEVVIKTDSEQRQYISSYKTTVKTYVKLKNDKSGYCISGKLLLNKTAKLRQTAVTDSLKHFAEYANPRSIPGPDHIMTDTELLTYMKPASFMIINADGSCGTGFFINENGLALTNHHVLDGKQNAVICFFGENGELDKTNYRKINRILLSSSGTKIDFTVFLVQLDNGEKVRYMPLVNQHIRDGEKIAKIGCPVGTVCNFQTGNLSNYNEGYFTHSIASNHGDSGGPIVNYYGEVVGINQSIEFNRTINEQAKGIAYGVDALLIRDYLKQYNINYEY